MQTQRNATLEKLIAEASDKLGDLAKWPDSEITLGEVNNAIKALRKTFKEDSYPRAFLYLAMCHIAHDIYGLATSREVKTSGLKLAWQKLGEMLE